MPADNQAISKFVGLQKKNFNRCMHLDFACEKQPIRAHSIQNSKVLDLLQENDHVIMPRPKISAAKEADLFKLADTQPLDVTNKEQLDQLAYRAVMREMHTCLQSANRFQLAHLDNVKKGITKANEPDGPGTAAIVFWEKAWRVFRYRSRFDEAFLKGERPALEHHVIELNDQAPTVAVSSLFSVDHDQAGDIIGPTLTVVPVDATKTVAILSYPKDQAQAITAKLPEFFDDAADKRKALSQLILQRVENFTLAPKFYDGWSDEKKKQVLQVFTENMMELKSPPENADINLF
jgi:hypothetical protein